MRARFVDTRRRFKLRLLRRRVSNFLRVFSAHFASHLIVAAVNAATLISTSRCVHDGDRRRRGVFVRASLVYTRAHGLCWLFVESTCAEVTSARVDVKSRSRGFAQAQRKKKHTRAHEKHLLQPARARNKQTSRAPYKSAQRFTSHRSALAASARSPMARLLLVV